ncbi:hypothetical protein HDU81_007376, partial [Chytriomyces hyalinus]
MWFNYAAAATDAPPGEAASPPVFNAAASAAATAAVGPPPADLHSLAYAEWYPKWMERYNAAMNTAIPPSQGASFASNQNAASIATVQNPPMTKMQQAMALLQQKANGGGSASSSDMYAKASQFKPQSKN